MRRLRILVTILCLTWTFGLVRSEPHASATDRCSGVVAEQEFDSRVATAGIWANLRRAEGSVQVASRRMLTEASAKVSSATPPLDACPDACEVDPTPVVVFRSTPRTLRSGYADADRCEVLEDQTESDPLAWRDREFESLDDLGGWIGRFAQGRGGEGQELYRRCDGPCSPRFTWLIDDVSDDTIGLDAEVVCGHARDRDDNQYELSYSLRWTCRAAVPIGESRIGGP